MSFAVIQTGGKQYKVAVGESHRFEKITGDFKVGDKVICIDIPKRHKELFVNNKEYAIKEISGDMLVFNAGWFVWLHKSRFKKSEKKEEKEA